MFQVFHLGVAKVHLRCCICCNDNIHVAIVCFKRFRYMFQVFHLDIAKVDLGVAHVTMVTHACFKCFICPLMYVTNVLSGCFKSRSGVARVAMAPVASHHLLLVREFPDQRHSPVVVTSSSSARPPGTM
jgi:hypothetical protein